MANPAAAGFVVCECCSARSVAPAQCGVDLRFSHGLAAIRVVTVEADDDLSVAGVDAEQHTLAGEESELFEKRIGDLHPRKSGPVLLLFGCIREYDGNARSRFEPCATWFKMGISHGQLL